MTTARDATRLRLAGLDGLRGVACLMVFLYHLRWHARPSKTVPLRLELFGFDLEHLLARFDAGVAIFFVLSGLLLSLPYWRGILGEAALAEARPFVDDAAWARAQDVWRRVRSSPRSGGRCRPPRHAA